MYRAVLTPAPGRNCSLRRFDTTIYLPEVQNGAAVSTPRLETDTYYSRHVTTPKFGRQYILIFKIPKHFNVIDNGSAN